MSNSLIKDKISTSKASKKVELSFVNIEGLEYLKMANYDLMDPFFMTIVSNSDHWLYISSAGGMTAGRRNSDHALFPYYTEDKLNDMRHTTGPKALISGLIGGVDFFWKPFCDEVPSRYSISRNLYKSTFHNAIIFEEFNEELQLRYQLHWNLSQKYGFVKKSILANEGTKTVQINLLDGFKNILPAGVDSPLQNAFSNLVDAYKICELDRRTGLALYRLGSLIADNAEPAEALLANTVWSSGFDVSRISLNYASEQYFQANANLLEENETYGKRGNYALNANFILNSLESKSWYMVADVSQDIVQITKLKNELISNINIISDLQADISKGGEDLKSLISSADGILCTSNKMENARHISNVLFNIMRGGVFADNYTIDTLDFFHYCCKSSHSDKDKYFKFVSNFSQKTNRNSICSKAIETKDPDLIRLAFQYLPLRFSRRHGDPSRPWNKFNINLIDQKTGKPAFEYEGNWRDVFQNWEALSCSFPGYLTGMISKFVNSSTFDGYNPYRIDKYGVDWEVIEPDNPWAYVGYWGDHQIIYLLYLLEKLHKIKPLECCDLLGQKWFVYSDIPYQIKKYEDILSNPKDTIIFSYQKDKALKSEINRNGANSVLLKNAGGQIHYVNLLEKLMASLLPKLCNFVMDGGIWMNTQRPEWNDANNALVGNGLSMVTAFHIHRFLLFFEGLLIQTKSEAFEVSAEFFEFFEKVSAIYLQYRELLGKTPDNTKNRLFLDALGLAASDFRWKIYEHGFSSEKKHLNRNNILTFINNAKEYLNETIKNNKRKDNLYHSYNLLTLGKNDYQISHLDEMLEGQVAALASKALNDSQVQDTLTALKSSKLWREDQGSYLLYPNKKLASFWDKNNIAKEDAENSKLAQRLLAIGNRSIILKDDDGNYHFAAYIKNNRVLRETISNIDDEIFQGLDTNREKAYLENIYEKIFNHKAFTGRSGTFFSYEGLGSIYWHMVSKLALSTQETLINSAETTRDLPKMQSIYNEIVEGIGVNKAPNQYGAFPSDPYSHTPSHKGAQQPGMTGQVKEDILRVWSDLGIDIQEGVLKFHPKLLTIDNFIQAVSRLDYYDVSGKKSTIELQKGQLFFTYCQVPIIYEISNSNRLKIMLKDGNERLSNELSLGLEWSEHLFGRTDIIDKIYVYINVNELFNSNI